MVSSILLTFIQTLLLIPFLRAYSIKVIIETAADEGNSETNVYLTLLGQNDWLISNEIILGKFEEGEIKEFEFTVISLDLDCLKFTLKGGTDGWRMEQSIVVLQTGIMYSFKNPGKEKLDNTFPWQTNSLKFCKKNTATFELVDKAGVSIVGQNEGLLLFNGGTVCDDKFSDTSAEAICDVMGLPHKNVSWRGGLFYETVQSGMSINLDKVICHYRDWFWCSFSIVHQCKHEEDIFLTCGVEKEEPLVLIIGSIVGAFLLVGLVVLFICLRRNARQSSDCAAEPFKPEMDAPQPVPPSAPPSYSQEMSQTVGIELLPCYEEVVASPNHFDVSRSS